MTAKIKFLCSSIMLLICLNVAAQAQKHPLEKADEMLETEARNLVIFLHTDWCQYCKAMQKTTFNNSKIRKLLTGNFYFAELNAEEKRTVKFGGQTYGYKPTGVNTGFHELATALSVDGKTSFPSLVILNPKREIIFNYNGFLSAADLEIVLKEIVRLEM